MPQAHAIQRIPVEVWSLILRSIKFQKDVANLALSCHLIRDRLTVEDWLLEGNQLRTLAIHFPEYERCYVKLVQTDKIVATAICRSAMRRDCPELFVERCLALKVISLDSNERGEIFEWSARTGCIKILDTFLKGSAFGLRSYFNLAMRLACEHGQVGVVDRLLQNPRFDPYALKKWVDKKYFAIYNGSDHAPVYLEMSCIAEAAERGHWHVIDRLLQYKRLPLDLIRHYPILIATLQHHFHVVDRLLDDPRVDASIKGDFLIDEAAATGHFDIVLRILAQHPNMELSSDGSYPLIQAVEQQRLDAVEKLLADPRVYPSSCRYKLTRMAVDSDRFDLVEKLLEHPLFDPSKSLHDIVDTIYESGRLDYLRQLQSNPHLAAADIAYIDILLWIDNRNPDRTKEG